MAKKTTKRGGKRVIPAEKRCTGTTKAGKPCGAPRAKGTAFCAGHSRTQKPAADVVDLSQRIEAKRSDHAAGRMTRDEYLTWLQGIMTGGTTEMKQTSKGDWEEVEACARDKMTAGREYRQLMDWGEANDGAGAVRRAIADIVADILG